MNKEPFLKTFNQGISKISCILFALISFSVVSNAGIKNIKPAAVFNVGFNKNNLADTGKVIISGSIKDEEGRPLENAIIIFDSTEVTTTGKDGKFSFTPAEIRPTLHKIYFSCDSFVTVVRTYYPAMLSAGFDIILRRHFDNGAEEDKLPFHVMNKDSSHTSSISKDSVHAISSQPIVIIKKSPVDTLAKEKKSSDTITVVLDFPSILFKENMTGLTGQDKSFLDIISEKLKSTPLFKVDIKAYTPEHDVNPLLTQKRLANIIKYLVEKGIDTGRLNKVIVVGGGDENTIDIVNP